ncbi:MAG: DUF429 domain-containing protein [Acidobacteriota bacterium]
MIVVGVDLAGPTRPEHTGLAVARGDAEHMELERLEIGAHDEAIHQAVRAAAARDDEVVVGLDAPLSVNATGGDRPADRRLRHVVMEAGLPSGTVMAPTMTRMAYLTLRGVLVARLVAPLGARVVEVHPSATLVLRGAPVADVRALKRSSAARARLLAFLEGRGLAGASAHAAREVTDHEVAACAAALGAHRWAHHRSVWLEAARPPHHPYDFAC